MGLWCLYSSIWNPHSLNPSQHPLGHTSLHLRCPIPVEHTHTHLRTVILKQTHSRTHTKSEEKCAAGKGGEENQRDLRLKKGENFSTTWRTVPLNWMTLQNTHISKKEKECRVHQKSYITSLHQAQSPPDLHMDIHCFTRCYTSITTPLCGDLQVHTHIFSL